MMPADCAAAAACRSCGGPLRPVLSLGRTPLANALLPADGAVAPELYPLDLVRCPSCSLVQLGQIVSPERLFSQYVYFSSFSETMLRHAERMAESLAEGESLGAGSLVVEIASNDGYLLQFFQRRGIPVLGVEPAQNVARVAEERGVPTVARFFDESLARELVDDGHAADLAIGNNVLAHVPDVNAFAAGVARLLKPTGLAVFEVPYLGEMLGRTEFDTIYHEHQCYFSATALAALFARHGLDLYDLEHQPIHGGTIRVFAAPGGRRPATDRLDALLAAERGWGVAQEAPYATFADRVGELRRALVELLAGQKRDGQRLAAYGASAKGVTLLSYCGIGAETLDFVVDRSTYKQGQRYPAGALPILPPEALLERRPDLALLLTWNFAEEILAQQRAYRAAGGRFVVPVPVPRLV